MNDTQDAGLQLIPAQSDRLKALGFEPGIPVYEIETPSFQLGAVKKALFESTYQSPVVLHLQSEREADAETPIGRGVDVVVVTVQAVYLPLEPSVGSGVFGCHNEPEWYVRGYLYKSPFDPHDGPIRVHVYLEVDGGSDREKVDRVMVQFVHEPSNADPATPLVYARKG